MRQLFLVIFLALTAGYIYVLSNPISTVPALGSLFDPVDGVYALARNAQETGEINVVLPGQIGDVSLIRDKRGVPHIYADNSLDAISALGYAVAQDRLFQLDFIPRVASGGLSEILGSEMIETDRFLRETGMDWGAKKNLERIREENGLELQILQAYIRGVNAYILSMEHSDLPLEFRLLGYKPELYTELHVLRILQYMTYDLTYRTSDPVYADLQHSLGEDQFSTLYPIYADLFVPIIPEKGGIIPPQEKRPIYATSGPFLTEASRDILKRLHDQHMAQRGSLTEGFFQGKGSNNWAVGPGRSESGSVILAGDMHLSLWLPAIWYEAHISTPEMNTYGVTIPGAPLPVEAFNNNVGWAFTNTGADQIDYVELLLDESGTRYAYEGEYLDFEVVSDTMLVKGRQPVVENRYYSHWGPVIKNEEGAIAIQWVAHQQSTTMRALWGMNHASSMDEFQESLMHWSTPMQNILFGDVEGNIAIRSTGILPKRKGGHGIGVLDGSTSNAEWIENVPFDELPYSYNPTQGYLTSTNQQPADSSYKHYQGYDWGPGYRSLRIDALLRGQDKHSLSDIKRYQSDVYVVQRDLFVPLLDSLSGLSVEAIELRKMLQNWEGISSIERVEPLVFDHFLDLLNDLTWDELEFKENRPPQEDRLYALLNGELQGPWLDRATTEGVEDAQDILRDALEQTVVELKERYGWDKANWRWGDHHKIVFKHYTRSEALKALWKGPFEFPGFTDTLSPAANRETTHSASWRVVVDFSTSPPTGYGVYPGGQSGNPFSPNYDGHVSTYLGFEYNPLQNIAVMDAFPPDDIQDKIVFSGQ